MSKEDIRDFDAFVEDIVSAFHGSLPNFRNDHVELLRAALDQARTYGKIDGVIGAEKALANWPNAQGENSDG